MKISVYVHGNDGACWDAGREAGLEGDALRMFGHAANEHRMTYEVDPSTGVATLVAVDGRRLEERPLSETQVF